jgi:hypothetical protein
MERVANGLDPAPIVQVVEASSKVSWARRSQGPGLLAAAPCFHCPPFILTTMDLQAPKQAQGPEGEPYLKQQSPSTTLCTMHPKYEGSSLVRCRNPSPPFTRTLLKQPSYGPHLCSMCIS